MKVENKENTMLYQPFQQGFAWIQGIFDQAQHGCPSMVKQINKRGHWNYRGLKIQTEKGFVNKKTTKY